MGKKLADLVFVNAIGGTHKNRLDRISVTLAAGNLRLTQVKPFLSQALFRKRLISCDPAA
ncbi:MAG: hypothetical protein WA836_15680 [Candidatus Binataceae bacterium]